MALTSDVITGLLREQYGFDGVVCTDWGLLTDVKTGGRVMIEAKCLGRGASERQRARRRKRLRRVWISLAAKLARKSLLIWCAVAQVREARIDESVRRLLRDKFRLGLFDDPYLDLEVAERIVGKPQFLAAGEEAQRKSIVLLKNGRRRDLCCRWRHAQAVCRRASRPKLPRLMATGRSTRPRKPTWPSSA